MELMRIDYELTSGIIFPMANEEIIEESVERNLSPDSKPVTFDPTHALQHHHHPYLPLGMQIIDQYHGTQCCMMEITDNWDS